MLLLHYILHNIYSHNSLYSFMLLHYTPYFTLLCHLSIITPSNYLLSLALLVLLHYMYCYYYIMSLYSLFTYSYYYRMSLAAALSHTTLLLIHFALLMYLYSVRLYTSLLSFHSLYSIHRMYIMLYSIINYLQFLMHLILHMCVLILISLYYPNSTPLYMYFTSIML